MTSTTQEFAIHADEIYPVYSVARLASNNVHDGIIHLTAGEWKEYQRAVEAFSDWQDRIELACTAWVQSEHERRFNKAKCSP